MSTNYCDFSKEESYKKQSVEYWNQHPFFAPDTVVLGIDIGIEGIGICVRKGTEILYDKSLLVDLPEAAPLEKRRTFRSTRHSHKNKKVRMRRLRSLFEQHNLPWVSNEVMRRTDPFILRYRALKSDCKLDSPEDLTVCIRNLVRNRGYDYYAMESKEIDKRTTSNELDTYPWGDSTSLVDVKKWLRNSIIDQKVVDIIDATRDEFIFREKQVDEKTWVDFRAFVDERKKVSDEYNIYKICECYAKKKKNKDFNRRARGMNFPRSEVARHLKEILEKHSDFIENYDDFIAALFRPCLTKEDKGKSIFYYNRKTPDEAKKHYEKKVKKCPFSKWLEIPEDERTRCLKKDPWYRRWNLVDFLSVRKFYLSQKVGKKEIAPLSVYRQLPESVVREIIQVAVPESDKRSNWLEVKKKMTASLAQEGWELSKEHKVWNDDQAAALKDLCAPNPKYMNGRAKMSSYACEKLFNIVTDKGSSFDPESMEVRKNESGLYEQRQKLTLDGGIFPQVASLLGTLGKKKKGSGQEDEQKTLGLLHSLFNKELASQLGGKTVPDYVVIECIRDVAKNQDQKKERAKEIEKRRQKKDDLKKAYGVDVKTCSYTDYLRLVLWEQQGGTPNSPARCPFKGLPLPTSDPLDPNLELAHLFPDSKGGYYIMDNLVLTTHKVNKIMGNYTPVEAARRGLFGQSAEQMIEASKFFRWGKTKRELFSWDKESFPDCFNNLTRVSQLASQLRKHVAFWLGILEDPQALRERIGTPHGEQTAAMRRSLLPDDPRFQKKRDTYTHHRVDAALLSCIPPTTGTNSIGYKGIFFNRDVGYVDSRDQKTKSHPQLFALTLGDGMPYPDIPQFLDEDTSVPVVRQRSSSKYKSLGDSTFWHVDSEGHTWQRVPLNPDKMKTSGAVLKALRDSRVPENFIPSIHVIEAWLDQCTEAMKGDLDEKSIPLLRLKNEKGEEKKGPPVKSYWKKESKGGLCSTPLGWSGTVNESGKISQLRSLKPVNDRVELWLGWNPKTKKGCWEYQSRVCPTVNAWRGLQRMGLLTKQLDKLPDFIRKVIEKAGDKSLKKTRKSNVRSLKDVILKKLYPHSILIKTIKRGDVAKVIFDFKSKDGDKKESREEWGEVTAILSNGQVQFDCLTEKNIESYSPSSPSVLARIFGLKSAAEEAQSRGLKP